MSDEKEMNLRQLREANREMRNTLTVAAALAGEVQAEMERLARLRELAVRLELRIEAIE